MADVKKHHGWCNGFTPGSDLTYTGHCDWCDGEKGLNANYPSKAMTEAEMMEKYFPNVRRVDEQQH